jgi:hypothetical protein
VVLLGGEERDRRLRTGGGALPAAARVNERGGTEREDDQAHGPLQRGVRSA